MGIQSPGYWKSVMGLNQDLQWNDLGVMWKCTFCVGYINSVDPVNTTAWEIMTDLQIMEGRGLSFFLLTQKINDVTHGQNWLTSSLWEK